jgi:hypothetical protein
MGNRKSGKSYNTRDILTVIYRVSGMKSFRDDLIDRMKTGWGCFVLASFLTLLFKLQENILVSNNGRHEKRERGVNAPRS